MKKYRSKFSSWNFNFFLRGRKAFWKQRTWHRTRIMPQQKSIIHNFQFSYTVRQPIFQFYRNTIFVFNLLSAPLKISRRTIRAYNGPRLIAHVTPWTRLHAHTRTRTQPVGKMSSGEPTFEDDADVTLQKCHFIPRHLEHNQVPFVCNASFPRGATLVSFVQPHPLHEMHVRIELIVAGCPSSRLFSPLSILSIRKRRRVWHREHRTVNRVVDRVKDSQRPRFYLRVFYF